MKLEELTEEEFEQFAYKNPLFSFHQTKEWANLKKTNGWDHKYVGLVENKEIKAATLLLSKKAFLKFKMFYSPRGFLIDYNNEQLVNTFTSYLKKYIKKNNGFFIKIDPYLENIERDIDGNPVENGINNEKVVNYLKKIGYKHYGFNKDTEKELQPRWIYVLDINGKSEDVIFDEFSKDTKRYINRCLKQGLCVDEITMDNIDEFKKIMEHTSSRRGFIDRPISYYKNMIDTLGDHIKILYSYLDTDKWQSELDEEANNIKIEEAKVEEKIKENPDSKKTKDAKKQLENSINQLNKKQDELNELKNKYGTKIVMASSMFIIYHNEIIYLYSGSYDYFMKYNPQYLIQWEIIKYCIKNNIPRYNFYGIDGNFDKNDNEMYGIYEFKRGFGGHVIEFIGEFDLVINKLVYGMYKIAFWLYKKLKTIKFMIRRKK